MSRILLISEGTNPDKKIIEQLLKVYCGLFWRRNF